MKIVYDTNALLRYYDTLSEDNENIIPAIVLDELDNIKSKYSGEKSYRARCAVRKIKQLNNKLIDMNFDRNHESLDSSRYAVNDDLIVECARTHGAVLFTDDYLAELKAEAHKVETINGESMSYEKEYSGYVEVNLTDQEIADFYQNPTINSFGLLENQYLIINNSENKYVDIRKWDGNHFTEIVERNISTMFLGKFKPKDVYQKAAIDSLINNDITLLKGKAGSGKSLIALSYAMHLLEKGKIRRIVCVVNPLPVRGAQEIGFYKGNKNEKLLQSGIGNILISKIGDPLKVEAMISTGEIVLIPMVDLRGYDTGSDSLIWITEAQNTSADLMKLSLQRVGEGSKIIIDGDEKTQLDSELFSGSNNGIKRLSKTFRGAKIYGEVELNTIYRSKIAEIAENM